MKWILVFCCVWTLQAKMIEAPHFHYLNEHVDEKTLVVLDIDDTLLIPKQMLGCDEWFQYRLRLHEQNGLEKKLAFQKALAEWEAIRHLTQMEIVEPGSEEIVKNLQEKSICVMGLTTQNMSLAARTSVHLKKHDIHLSRTAPKQEDHYFTLGELGVLYKNGILFTSGVCKGTALFQFCDAIGYSPKKIVFINDKASHLSEVEKVAKQRGVEFVGLRYGYSDARKKAFRSDVAEYQFANSSFAQLLSDQEALERLEKRK